MVDVEAAEASLDVDGLVATVVEATVTEVTVFPGRERAASAVSPAPGAPGVRT
jgi:hypothetical protein